jgi:hypothetical protein
VRVGFIGCAIALAGCGGAKVETPAPIAAPAAVAEAFMQAVADSNMSHMAELWGTTRGAAASTNVPNNWPQRISVIHAYLKGGSARILGEDPGLTKPDRRRILVELTRSGCTKTVPFTMVLTKQGSWLVNAIDLSAAGVPGRPCDPSKPAAPSGGRAELLGQLDQDAGRGFWMDERDPLAPGAHARNFVDETVSGSPAAVERLVEVLDAIADVVDAGTSASNELADRTVRPDRFEQLDVRLAERKRYDGGPVLNLGPVVGREAKNVSIEGQRRVDLLHGDADVRDAGGFEHGSSESDSVRKLTQKNAEESEDVDE